MSPKSNERKSRLRFFRVGEGLYGPPGVALGVSAPQHNSPKSTNPQAQTERKIFPRRGRGLRPARFGTGFSPRQSTPRTRKREMPPPPRRIFRNRPRRIIRRNPASAPDAFLRSSKRCGAAPVPPSRDRRKRGQLRRASLAPRNCRPRDPKYHVIGQGSMVLPNYLPGR